MNNYDMALSYIRSLTGSEDSVCDFRVINDRNAAEQAINIRGTFADVYNSLKQYNQYGYGIFITVNAMKPDSKQKTLENVDYIRAQVADIDDPLISQDSYQRAVSSTFPPHFAVQTSVGKYHLYWLVQPYRGNDFYERQQRKLCQLYNGDKHVVDATRVLRVPGFNHWKGEPHLVICWSISNKPRYSSQDVADALATIDVPNVQSSRKPLGDSTLAAPSLEWLNFALNMVDPNTLAREEWLGLSAAFKQAGWTLANPEELFRIWQEWCAIYKQNNPAENAKLWNSIKDSEVGWARFQRLTNVNAYYNNNPLAPPTSKPLAPTPTPTSAPTPTTVVAPIINLEQQDDVLLDTAGKKKWFKNCYFVEREGKIFSPTGRFMNQTQFNGSYGGKEFCTRLSGGSN